MAAAALWLVLFGVLYALTRMTVYSLFGIAPLIVATVADERRTAIFAGAAVALAVGFGWWEGSTADGVYWTRLAVVCAIGAMAVVVAGIRRRREERLARMTAIAQASQLALLGGLQGTGYDAGQVVAHRVQVNRVFQPGRKCGDSLVGVVPGPVEPPVHRALHPVPTANATATPSREAWTSPAR